MSDTGRDLYKFEPDRIHLHFAHGLGKRQTAEPVEQTVGQTMQLKPFGIHDHGRGTDRAKVKAVLPLFDEVFHGSAVAVYRQ